MMTDLSGNRTARCFFAALLCAMLISISAYAADYGDISVKVEKVTGGLSNAGYEEYRATIINRSPAKTHRVTLVFFAEAGMAEVSEVRRTVEVAPSSSATIALFKPQMFYSTGISVLIDGTRQDAPVAIDESRTSAWVSRSRNNFHLLVSRNVEKSGLMNEAAVAEGFKNAEGENDVAHLAYQSPMPEWSTSWLGYSSFNGVIITADELNSAPDAVRTALWRYVECGGSLLVIGKWEVPKQWRQARRQIIGVAEGESEEQGKLGLTAKTDFDAYHVGFGEVLVIGDIDPKRIPPAQWFNVKLGWKNSRPGAKAYYDLADINKDFPVVERIGIPVRGLFALMLAFVVVIGPVNLIWLARRRKKIWMLWTVPAIALVTCLAVMGFALFGEGVSATSRTAAFTILDETSHRATTIGWTAFYSPITPSEGLHFSYDTDLMPQWPGAWGYRDRRDSQRTIDWSSDQHLASEWITARVPAYFKFRKSEMRRERLTVRQSASGAISVVNGLGVDIQALWLADSAGRVHSAKSISAGGQASLSSINLQAASDGSGLRELFGNEDWLARMKLVEQNPAQHLMPGCYLAVLDASPFVEEGLKDVKTRKARTLVYGVSAEGER